MTMTTSARAVLIAAVSAVLMVPASLDAQRGPQGRRGIGMDRSELEQRVRAQMGRMIQQRLALDEEQAAALSEVVENFDVRRLELGRLEQATRRRVEALILEGNGDEEEARELLQRMSNLRVREAELFGAEQAALLGVLTPGQVLELQNLRQDLGRRIRALRGGGRRGVPGNGRGRGR